MALISLNPHSMYDICVRLAANENKCILVIDNRHYHTLSDEKKAEVYEYYKDPIDEDEANWIIPEAEIDAIIEAEELFYVFDTEILAVDCCFDWFPRPENLPDLDHHIKAYVIKPDGTIPYVNENSAPDPLTITEE
jgi:hypothetical protein